MPHPQPRRGECRYRDYQTWPEHERWQLLDGHAHAMAPPSVRHQQVVFELGRQIGNQLVGQRCQGLIAPVGVRLPDGAEADAEVQTVFEPDLLVVCDPGKLDSRGVRGAPDFIIEVLSPSTASFDQVDKRERYERAGVRELWLIDPLSALLTVYRRDGDRFAAADIRRAEGRVEVQAIDGMALELDFLAGLRVQESP